MDADIESSRESIMNLAINESIKLPFNSPEECQQLQTMVDDLRDKVYDLRTLADSDGVFEVVAGDQKTEQLRKSNSKYRVTDCSTARVLSFIR